MNKNIKEKWKEYGKCTHSAASVLQKCLFIVKTIYFGIAVVLLYNDQGYDRVQTEQVRFLVAWSQKIGVKIQQTWEIPG